jgi:hypothetical protein
MRECVVLAKTDQLDDGIRYLVLDNIIITLS